jgi:DNA-binding protein HU-beta
MAIHSRLEGDELVARVAERTGFSPKTVEKIVEAVFEEIYEALKRGKSVTLRNFGNFYIRPEKESWVFRFNPAQRLRKLFGWSSTYKGQL